MTEIITTTINPINKKLLSEKVNKHKSIIFNFLKTFSIKYQRNLTLSNPLFTFFVVCFISLSERYGFCKLLWA